MDFKVTVNKNELLAKLKVNRENHLKIYNEAVTGFRKAVIEELDKALGAAKTGKLFVRLVDLQVNLNAPVDQTADYDRVIGMLEMSTNTEIELHEEEFNCYVLDKWRWRHSFLASNAGYSEAATAALNG
jgi:hypothetical protein